MRASAAGTRVERNCPGSFQGHRNAEEKLALARCQEIAARRLAHCITGAVSAVEDELLIRADRFRGTVQQTLLDATANLGKSRSRIGIAFVQHYSAIFSARIAAEPSGSGTAARTPYPDMSSYDLSSLALVDETGRDEELVVDMLSQKAIAAMDEYQLFEIRSQVSQLLGTDVADDRCNPVLPPAVFDALALACRRELDGTDFEQRAVLEGFAPFVIAELGDLYREISGALTDLGILPELRRTLRSEPRSEARSGKGLESVRPGRQTTWRDGFGSTVLAGLTTDLGAALAHVMRGPPAMRSVIIRMLSNPVAHGFEEAMQIPAAPALLDVLDTWQESATESLSADTLLSRLDRRTRESSHPLDLLTIEFVATVFEKLLEDRSIPTAVRAELARLQIVAIKAAILDRNFFAERSHPMRRLLDRIADAANDVECNTEAGSTFVIGLHRIVSDIVQRFKDDLSSFSEAMRELDALIEQVRKPIEHRVEEFSSAINHQEKLELVRLTCAAEISRRMQPYVPTFLRDFLTTTWLQALAESHGRDDSSEDGFKSRLEVVDALIWSVAPLSCEQIRQLATILPLTMRNVMRGMVSVRMPKGSRSDFFRALMQVHLESIERAKARLDSARNPTHIPSLPPTDPDRAALEVRSPPKEFGSGRDEFDRLVASLKPSTVLELAGNIGSGRVVVAWVSPSGRTLVLNSDRGGMHSVESEALAEELRASRAIVLSKTSSPIDRILSNLAQDPAQH